VRTRAANAQDAYKIVEFLTAHGAAKVARRDQLVDATAQPALLAEADGRLCGVLTYIESGADCEVLTLHTQPRGAGTGTALIEAFAAHALRLGCERLWLVTTNDNLDALRFYQRRGFFLTELRPGAVDRSRALLKPEIPRIGNHGIPLRDELELVRPLH
jgi:N-acetylglutamate synthase-like GNAT family acetyltransferase